MKPFFEAEGVSLFLGDALEVMKSFESESIDAICCDPPYFLHFMGRKWDHAPNPTEQQKRHEAWGREAIRVLKPGGFMLAMGGERTYHRLVSGIEDAGFEIRTTITWHHGQGFPKSLNVSRELLALPWCSCGSGDVASSGTVDAVPANERSITLGADASVSSSSSLLDRDNQPFIRASSPAEGIGTSNGATLISSPGDGFTTDGTGGLGLEARMDTSERSLAMQGGIIDMVGKLDPVMLGSSGMTSRTDGHEVVECVSGVEVNPEALRNHMMGEETVCGAAKSAGLVPLEYLGGYVGPTSSLVRPLASAPGGVPVPRQPLSVSDAHTGSRTVARDLGIIGEVAEEVVPADLTAEPRRSSLVGGALLAAEKNRLEGTDALAGAKPSLSIAGLEGNSALLAGFGKHTDIIRQGITKNHISVCAKCHRPVRPEWVIDGLGTALKPSTEFICMARRPLEESSIARNVLKHGTSALNIDACRVSTDWSTDPTRRGWQGGNTSEDYDGGSVRYAPGSVAGHQRVSQPNSGGRWPSNLVLSHVPPDETGEGGCERVGVKRVRSGDSKVSESTPSTVKGGLGGKVSAHYADPDGFEEVEDWRCVDSCPVAELDRQSGVSKSNVRRSEDRDEPASTWALGRKGVTARGHSDKGGASRFFPTFEPEEDSFMNQGENQLSQENVPSAETPSQSESIPQNFENPGSTAQESAQGEPLESPLDVGPGFLYCAKSSRRERNRGLEERHDLFEQREGMPEKATQEYGSIRSNRGNGYEKQSVHSNFHPTCKPVSLMKWLCTLVGVPGGTILDPFLGSGTTGVACRELGFNFIGIEMESDYMEISRARIANSANAEASPSSKRHSPSAPHASGKIDTALQDSLFHDSDYSEMG